MRSTDKSTYLRFLNLAQAIRQLSSFPQIDAVEERLLNVCAAAWHAGRKLTVLEAMKLLPDTSESTAFRRLKSLRSKGMVCLDYDANDARTRYVMPTDLANAYFEKLGECLNKAQQT